MSGPRTAQDLLGLRTPPIAIGFLDSPPADVPRWDGGAVPAGCSFWQRAMEGASFYTLPSDHFNCAIGCHTHRIALPPDRRAELTASAQMMVSTGYLRPSDVLGIPTLTRTPAVIAYAPIDRARFAYDLVLLAAAPAQSMLIGEAALRLGDGSTQTISTLGRPACGLLPFVKDGGQPALSLGCAGNRTFTGLPEDQMYFAVPSARWAHFEEALREIAAANEVMGRYYEGKKATGR
jgi:uncharacterized protein (DUF169 family)